MCEKSSLHLWHSANISLWFNRGQEEETADHLFLKCDISQMFCSELKRLLLNDCANCTNLFFLEGLALFGTTTNCTTDKPTELVIYKCKLQVFMPVMSVFVFQTISRSRYNIENYQSFTLGKNFRRFKQRLAQEKNRL